MADVRTMKLNLLADVAKFGQGLQTAEKDTKDFSNKIGDYSKKMAKAFAVAAAAAGVMVAKFGIDGVKAASDLNEEVSKAEVIFGDVSDEIKAFSKTADQALGLSQKEALNAASTFATFGKASGLTGKDLSKFSKSATVLASDLGSFYNTKAEDAINAIGAALRGEAEPIRKYGVLLDDATLKAKAMEMGLYDGKGALDTQAKSLATYQVILDQTKDAQGDFARTSDGMAGQQKILTAQLENLKVTMGEKLLPVFQNIVTQANFVAKAFAGKDAESLSERARELAGTYDGQGAGAYNLGLALTNVATSFGELFASITQPASGESVSLLQQLADSLNKLAMALQFVSDVYSKGKGAFEFVRTLGGNFDPNLVSPTNKLGRISGNAAGGSVMGNEVTRVGEFGPEIFVPNGVSGSIRKDNASGSGVTIIMNGVIDAESARRSIERLFQNSTRRTGPLNFAGSQL